MEDDYVTFEQAKALKELGFPQWSVEDNSKDAYDCEGEVWSMRYFDQHPQDYYSIASLSLVQKWLRKEKGLSVEATAFSKHIYMFSILKLTETGLDILNSVQPSEEFSEPEEALLAGIDKAIEILKQ